MLKILKIFENFENYDARQMRVISSGKLQMRRTRHFPQKIQGHLLSCLWTAKNYQWSSILQLQSQHYSGLQRECLREFELKKMKLLPGEIER